MVRKMYPSLLSPTLLLPSLFHFLTLLAVVPVVRAISSTCPIPELVLMFRFTMC
jgi:hypothetical protein